MKEKKWHIYNLDHDPLLLGEALIEFDDEESAYQFIAAARKNCGMGMENFVVNHTAAYGYDEYINATGKIPIFANGEHILVEA